MNQYCSDTLARFFFKFEVLMLDEDERDYLKNDGLLIGNNYSYSYSLSTR